MRHGTEDSNDHQRDSFNPDMSPCVVNLFKEEDLTDEHTSLKMLFYDQKPEINISGQYGQKFNQLCFIGVIKMYLINFRLKLLCHRIDNGVAGLRERNEP